MRSIPLWLGLVVAVWSCHSSANLASRISSPPKDVVTTSIKSLEESVDARKEAAGATVETHHDGDASDGDFQLAVVEFSDEGIAWRPEQRNLVLDTVKKAGEPNGAIVVVFVHGWRHNATVCDDNVACFRRVLQSFSRREHDTAAGGLNRAVIGVYLGWRGLSSCDLPLSTTSIWRRKSVGENLGARAGREVIRQLMVAFGSIKQNHPSSRLIIAGHSLGAGAVYSAVGPLLLQRLHDAVPPDAKNITIQQIEDLDPIGTPVPLPDLVLLLNPAFEAELYKPLQRSLSSMQANNVRFADDQPPVMLTISSRHDTATKGIFFLGQFLDALVKPTMWFHGPAYLVRHMVTPPHLWSYITDRAVPTGTMPSRKGSRTGDSCFSGDPFKDAVRQKACGCAELTPSDIAQVTKDSASYAPDTATAAAGNVRSYGVVNLEHLRGDINNPFLVVTAGDLIRDHDDIYNPTLLTFVTNLISRVDAQKRREKR